MSGILKYHHINDIFIFHLRKELLLHIAFALLNILQNKRVNRLIHYFGNHFFTQINMVVYVLVICGMKRTRYMQNKTQIGKLKAGVKASAVILPLLGVTWLFGLLSFNSDTIAFKYIFTVFNSLQGLMIFIFHCVLNKQVSISISSCCYHFSV